MKRLAGVAVGIALALSGCGGGGSEQYYEVCLDAAGNRVDESMCMETRPAGYPWGYVYLPYSYPAPRYYTHVEQNVYVTQRPANARVYTGHAPNGGTLPKKAPRKQWSNPPKSNGGTYKPSSTSGGGTYQKPKTSTSKTGGYGSSSGGSKYGGSGTTRSSSSGRK